jgi:MFS family permease
VSAVRLLRQRDYGLLWAGTLVSDAGDWLLIIALPVAVFAMTGSAMATSAVFLAELLPMLALGTVAGVLVDRWDPRRALVVIALVQAVLLLPLLAVRSAADLWIVVAVAAAQSTMVALASPAKFAILPALVDAEDLTGANSLVAMNQNLARLVGSPLGGLVYDVAGLTGVVLVDAVSFVGGAVLVALITRRSAGGGGAPERPGLVAEWLDGLRVVRRSRALSVALLSVAISQFAQGVFVVLFVVFVQRSLGGGGAEVGLLRGVQAVGAVAGALLLGMVARRLRPAALAGYGFLVLGVLELLIWNLPADHRARRVRGAVRARWRAGGRRDDRAGDDRPAARPGRAPGPGRRRLRHRRVGVAGLRRAGRRAARRPPRPACRAQRAGGADPARRSGRARRPWRASGAAAAVTAAGYELVARPVRRPCPTPGGPGRQRRAAG